jgi:ketosteroid isomerase-like protein
MLLGFLAARGVHGGRRALYELQERWAPEQTELRATHVYRREDGQWRAVHRHADRRPPGP